jgi:hypothetical protein
MHFHASGTKMATVSRIAIGRSAVGLLLAMAVANGLLYDVLEPKRVGPPNCTCTEWAKTNATVQR